MAKIILINPSAKNSRGSPLLSQMYLASSLLAHGHEVKIFDLDGQLFEYSIKSLTKDISSFQPDIIGLTIYTFNALSAYDFIEKLKTNINQLNCLLVAGGSHPTAVPTEPLEHGFDVVVRGEGEETIVELARACGEINNFKNINGISYRASSGEILHTNTRPFNKDLNAIPRAVDSLPLFNSEWYLKHGTFAGVPAGMLTSRGCTGKCTFCANNVTGRQFRFRSAKNVLDEMKYYYEMYTTTFFSFWDDCFTSSPKHVTNICEKLLNLKRMEGIELQWSCNSRADRLSKTLLKTMKTAGCISITFGIESGSVETLEKIRKNIDLENVKNILGWCKALGLRAQVNFMLGFPWETEKHLQDTLDYMKKITGLVDAFSTRGVVIPFPGTELYEIYKKNYNFENWWLEHDIIEKIDNFDNSPQKPTGIMGGEIENEIYLNDPVLDMTFFGYSSKVKKMIKKCLGYKGEQTLKKINEPIRI